MTLLRKIVFVIVMPQIILALLLLIALSLPSGKVGATTGCDWYLQHTPSPQYPDGWGECMTGTPPTPTETSTPVPTQEVTPTTEPTKEVTPTDVPTLTDPSPTPEPTQEPTEASPTPVTTDEPSATPSNPTGTPVPPQTATPTEAKHTCTRKCIYQLGGISGTHAVTAVSPNEEGTYTWQVKINGVWYDIYDCYGVEFVTNAESRGTTSIVRLTVDGTAPTDPNSYRISGGAAAYLFDDHSY